MSKWWVINFGRLRNSLSILPPFSFCLEKIILENESFWFIANGSLSKSVRILYSVVAHLSPSVPTQFTKICTYGSMFIFRSRKWWHICAILSYTAIGEFVENDTIVQDPSRVTVLSLVDLVPQPNTSRMQILTKWFSSLCSECFFVGFRFTSFCLGFRMASGCLTRTVIDLSKPPDGNTDKLTVHNF